jgi:hypothetical protein
MASDDVERCPICDWPLAASTREGCVAGNCSYRPSDPAEQARLRLRRRDVAEAAHAADRERLRRLVAAVRRVHDDSLGLDCTGGAAETVRLSPGVVKVRTVDCAGAKRSPAEWCPACALLAELEACEEAGT